MDMYDCTVGTLHVQNVMIYAVRYMLWVGVGGRVWVCIYIHRWMCGCVHMYISECLRQSDLTAARGQCTVKSYCTLSLQGLYHFAL